MTNAGLTRLPGAMRDRTRTPLRRRRSSISIDHGPRRLPRTTLQFPLLACGGAARRGRPRREPGATCARQTPSGGRSSSSVTGRGAQVDATAAQVTARQRRRKVSEFLAHAMAGAPAADPQGKPPPPWRWLQTLRGRLGEGLELVRRRGNLMGGLADRRKPRTCAMVMVEKWPLGEVPRRTSRKASENCRKI